MHRPLRLAAAGCQGADGRTVGQVLQPGRFFVGQALWTVTCPDCVTCAKTHSESSVNYSAARWAKTLVRNRPGLISLMIVTLIVIVAALTSIEIWHVYPNVLGVALAIIPVAIFATMALWVYFRYRNG